MKATRHNGRSGKNGTYNPRHNDRRFDLENSEHIDAGRVRENIYWDCYRGYTTMQNREEDSQDISFEKIECTFYQEHYGKYIEAQKTRIELNKPRIQGINDRLITAESCTPLSGEDDLHGKIVVVKPDVLRREYRRATHQLKLCTGGFGASPHSRGTACFCIDLYTGKESRYERMDVMGTMEPENLPGWARHGLTAIQQEQAQKKTNKERER